MTFRAFPALLATLSLAFAATAAGAEEGMWTLDNFPIARANAALGTNIDQAFLGRVQAASVRLGGCSAGLVSGQGLILTNNHCVRTCVQNLSTPQTQYALTGFTPASLQEERRCPGMQAEVLLSITDVTARMHAAGTGLSGEAFTRARDAEAAAIESGTCGLDPVRRCQVVTLYRGGQFKLYVFRRYEDVRLVFAPEDRAASFGGDLDNFSFPRFGLDAAFVRLYEAGVPVATPVHFKWSPKGAQPGEAVFVAGNPGATQRLITQAQLGTQRDIVLPLDLLTWSELRGRLLRFGEESPENRFIAQAALDTVENQYKRAYGRLRALQDSRFLGQRQAAEDELRAKVAADPALAAQIGDPWQVLAGVQADYRRLYPGYLLLEDRAGGGSQLFLWARALVRGAQERTKPNGERLSEFGDARLRNVERQLLADAPVYPQLDTLQLAWWLSKTREFLTVDDPRVRALLGNESPEALAARLTAGTRLADPAVRKALWDGGLAAIEASDDPLIRFLLAIQPVTRQTRAEWDARITAPTDRAAEALARARFAVYGDRVYPDATLTLRLSYGRVEGWTYDGRTVGPTTTFGGLFERATGAEPFDVAPRWLAAKDRLNMATVFNVAASTDTIGGSSGSPAVNAAGEIVGANFDSTLPTQRNAYGYDRGVNRSVLVSTAAITEALDKVYGQQRLLDELGVKPPKPGKRKG